MLDRFERTTEHLRSTAVAMLRDRGSRAFSMEALARAADVGIGTVYERWENRTAVIDDIISIRVLDWLSQQVSHNSETEMSERLRHLFDSDDGREMLLLASEVLFAGRDEPQFERHVHEVVSLMRRYLSGDAIDSEHGSVNWWLTALAFGWGTLMMGEASLPLIGDDVVIALTGADILRSYEGVPSSSGKNQLAANDVVHDDPISQAIVKNARELLSLEDGPEFSAREIGRRAGVSKGALYRRYGSRTAVLVKVLATDLDEERFAWTHELVEVLESDNPINGAAQAMERTLRRVYDDEPMMRRLLEVTVAARSSGEVRSTVMAHINVAVNERLDIIRGLQDAEVLKLGVGAESLSWFIQAVPIGTRLMASLGYRPERTTVVESFQSLLENLVQTSTE